MLCTVPCRYLKSDLCTPRNPEMVILSFPDHQRLVSNQLNHHIAS